MNNSCAFFVLTRCLHHFFGLSHFLGTITHVNMSESPLQERTAKVPLWSPPTKTTITTQLNSVSRETTDVEALTQLSMVTDWADAKPDERGLMARLYLRKDFDEFTAIESDPQLANRRVDSVKHVFRRTVSLRPDHRDYVEEQKQLVDGMPDMHGDLDEEDEALEEEERGKPQSIGLNLFPHKFSRNPPLGYAMDVEPSPGCFAFTPARVRTASLAYTATCAAAESHGAAFDSAAAATLLDENKSSRSSALAPVLVWGVQPGHERLTHMAYTSPVRKDDGLVAALNAVAMYPPRIYANFPLYWSRYIRQQKARRSAAQGFQPMSVADAAAARRRSLGTSTSTTTSTASTSTSMSASSGSIWPHGGLSSSDVSSIASSGPAHAASSAGAPIAAAARGLGSPHQCDRTGDVGMSFFSPDNAAADDSIMDVSMMEPLEPVGDVPASPGRPLHELSPSNASAASRARRMNNRATGAAGAGDDKNNDEDEDEDADLEGTDVVAGVKELFGSSAVKNKEIEQRFHQYIAKYGSHRVIANGQPVLATEQVPYPFIIPSSSSSSSSSSSDSSASASGQAGRPLVTAVGHAYSREMEEAWPILLENVLAAATDSFDSTAGSDVRACFRMVGGPAFAVERHAHRYLVLVPQEERMDELIYAPGKGRDLALGENGSETKGAGKDDAEAGKDADGVKKKKDRLGSPESGNEKSASVSLSSSSSTRQATSVSSPSSTSTAATATSSSSSSSSSSASFSSPSTSIKSPAAAALFDILRTAFESGASVVAEASEMHNDWGASVAYPHIRGEAAYTVRSLLTFTSPADGALHHVVALLDPRGHACDNHGPYSRYSPHWPERLRTAIFKSGAAIPGLFFMDLLDYVDVMRYTYVCTSLLDKYAATMQHTNYKILMDHGPEGRFMEPSPQQEEGLLGGQVADIDSILPRTKTSPDPPMILDTSQYVSFVPDHVQVLDLPQTADVTLRVNYVFPDHMRRLSLIEMSKTGLRLSLALYDLSTAQYHTQFGNVTDVDCFNVAFRSCYVNVDHPEMVVRLPGLPAGVYVAVFTLTAWGANVTHMVYSARAQIEPSVFADKPFRTCALRARHAPPFVDAARKRSLAVQRELCSQKLYKILDHTWHFSPPGMLRYLSFFTNMPPLIPRQMDPDTISRVFSTFLSTFLVAPVARLTLTQGLLAATHLPPELGLREVFEESLSRAVEEVTYMPPSKREGAFAFLNHLAPFRGAFTYAALRALVDFLSALNRPLGPVMERRISEELWVSTSNRALRAIVGSQLTDSTVMKKSSLLYIFRTPLKEIVAESFFVSSPLSELLRSPSDLVHGSWQSPSTMCTGREPWRNTFPNAHTVSHTVSHSAHHSTSQGANQGANQGATRVSKSTSGAVARIGCEDDDTTVDVDGDVASAAAAEKACAPNEDEIAAVNDEEKKELRTDRYSSRLSPVTEVIPGSSVINTFKITAEAPLASSLTSLRGTYHVFALPDLAFALRRPRVSPASASPEEEPTTAVYTVQVFSWVNFIGGPLARVSSFALLTTRSMFRRGFWTLSTRTVTASAALAQYASTVSSLLARTVDRVTRIISPWAPPADPIAVNPLIFSSFSELAQPTQLVLSRAVVTVPLQVIQMFYSALIDMLVERGMRTVRGRLSRLPRVDRQRAVAQLQITGGGLAAMGMLIWARNGWVI